jgi:polysaccharide export outer membrane protein
MQTRIFLLTFLLAVLLHIPASAAEALVLGPNDKITVRCLNAEEFPVTPIRIDGDGQITLPLIGRWKIAGLTVGEAEHNIASALSRFIRNPDVSVNIVESNSQPVTVLGAVNKPGSYQIDGDKTLAEIVGIAGGLRADAGATLKISRRKSFGNLPLPSAIEDAGGGFYTAEIDADDVVQSRKPALNIAIRPFDVVSVPQAEIVYVVGQVRKPGGFAMQGRGGTTILQALSLAEGLDRTAAPQKARVIRRGGPNGDDDLPVDVSKILAGKAKDLPLRANDVLFIPNNLSKSVGTKTLETVLQVATGVVIYGRY